MRPDGTIVLLDHGLYKHLDDEFRLQYARLWRAILLADVGGIETAARNLGVEAYPLLAAILTHRPWDDLVAPARASTEGEGDDVLIRTYAQKYAKQITRVLNAAPRQLLLLLKMSDCLRRLDSALASTHDANLLTLHVILDVLHAHDRDHLAYFRSKLRLWAFRLLRPRSDRAAAFAASAGPAR